MSPYDRNKYGEGKNLPYTRSPNNIYRFHSFRKYSLISLYPHPESGLYASDPLLRHRVGEREKMTLQKRNLANATLPKWARLRSPAISCGKPHPLCILPKTHNPNLIIRKTWDKSRLKAFYRILDQSSSKLFKIMKIKGRLNAVTVTS